MANNNKDKVLNAPPLRFPEFSGEWKRVRVSDLLDFYSTNSLAWEALNYGGGEILNLHYGLIHKGLPTLIDTERESLPFINEANTPRKYTRCQCGDVAFADASEDTNEVGKAIEFVNVGDGNVVCGLHTIHGRDKSDSTTVGYKGYAFNSMPFHYQMRRIAQGTKIYSINTKNFDEVFIGLPSKDEQKKIAELLSLIDDRIATQIGLIEDLKKLKSAIYQYVFKERNEHNVLLESVCSIVKGRQVNGEELNETGLYYVMNGGIEPSGYYDRCNVDANTISISEGGNSCGYVQYNDRPFWSGGHCYTLQHLSSKVDNKYLYHFLKSRQIEIMKLRIGSGLPNIQKKDLARIEISLPAIEEQKKIAERLSAIEQKITVETEIKECYARQRQFLLSQMFV